MKNYYWARHGARIVDDFGNLVALTIDQIHQSVRSLTTFEAPGAD